MDCYVVKAAPAPRAAPKLKGSERVKPRYRRSTVCRAPRKRTFIANMQKFVIDAELPSGLAGESFFGASSLCCVSACAPISGMTQRSPVEAAQLLASGNGGGNGGAIAYQLGGGDDGEAGEQLSVLPLAVAVALCAALYPALESLAPSPAPAMAVAVPAAALQLAVPAAAAEARMAKETRAVDVEALVKAFEPSSEGASEVSESKVLALA